LTGIALRTNKSSQWCSCLSSSVSSGSVLVGCGKLKNKKHKLFAEQHEERADKDGKIVIKLARRDAFANYKHDGVSRLCPSPVTATFK
jgi:hypothetical protein